MKRAVAIGVALLALVGAFVIARRIDDQHHDDERADQRQECHTDSHRSLHRSSSGLVQELLPKNPVDDRRPGEMRDTRQMHARHATDATRNCKARVTDWTHCAHGAETAAWGGHVIEDGPRLSEVT